MPECRLTRSSSAPAFTSGGTSTPLHDSIAPDQPRQRNHQEANLMRECTADTRLQHASIAPEIEPTSHALKNGDNGGSRNANDAANNTISSAVDNTESSTESSTASNNISSNTSNRLDKSSSIDELTIETPHTNQNTESSNQHFRHHWHNLFMRGFPHHSTAQHASSLPETFHETSHNSALSLTATERELYYLKFVKPSDFT
ncbi:MAG: hypothetical protein P8176_15275, partial [Gammaproteobacteria bacterium]